MKFLGFKNAYRSATVLASLILCATPFLVSGASSSPSTLYFSPATGSFHKNENFNVSVLVNSDQAINAVSGNIKFDTNTLEVMSVSKADTIVNLWTQTPSFSNQGVIGNVNFEGIILNPGFEGKAGKIINIGFRVKKEGISRLTVSNLAIMANDGKGTNVAAEGGEARFTLLPERPAQQVKNGSSEIVPTVIVREIVKEAEATDGYWDLLPAWIRSAILILVGTATVVMVLVTISFGLLVLIWMWGTLRRQGDVIARRLMLIPAKIKLGALRVMSLGSSAAKEMESDVRFSIAQVEKEIAEAKQGVSFGQLAADYCRGAFSIIKRFLTRNEVGGSGADDRKTVVEVLSSEENREPDIEMPNSKRG